MTKWNIREEEYSKIILTDVLEFYIIELPKFEKYYQKIDNNNLNLWIRFIKNPEVIDVEETNKQIDKARKVLEEISNDERERYLAELRQKYIMDQKAIEGAGYDKGLKAGMELGKKTGMEQAQKQIAKKMKNQDMEVEVIMQITGLSKEEIMNL